jgi:hypothetical protein
MLPTPHDAAANNAAWCDAFCRTHGVVGRFERDAWISPTRTPPLYPDAVTLTDDADGDVLLAAIDAGPGCSVKDSFARLDLEPAGFAPLADAQWIACARAPAADDWVAVTSAAELEDWERAWAGAAFDAPTFRPALLGEPGVRVLARREGGDVVAGAIACAGGGAVGLTNVFGEDLAAAWAGAAAAVGGAVVAWDAGEQLEGALAAGFAPIGRLVVWLRS